MTEFTRVPFEVYIEDTKETIILQLTTAEAARASTDYAFVLTLINQEKERRKHMTISQICEIQKGINVSNAMSIQKDLAFASSSFASEADFMHIPLSAHSAQNTSTQNIEESTGNEKSLFIWSSKNVHLLLEKYEERMNEFSSGTKRHSKIWKSIANDMNNIDPEISVLGTQCQSKMNSMKKIFKKIIDHNSISGNDRKSWQYFEKMYELFGKSGWTKPKATASEAGPSNSVNSTENVSPATKKSKSEKGFDEFVKQMKRDRQEREERKEARKLVVLQELKNQKEKQHNEKMDIMKKFCKAIAGKTLFD